MTNKPQRMSPTESGAAQDGPSLDQQPTVYFDGSCPLCAAEISVYRKGKGAKQVNWCDVSSAEMSALGSDLNKTQAMARFHVRRADGQLLSGAAAFAELWRAMPGFRWLGALLRFPPVLWAAERLYRLFLNVRPLLQSAAHKWFGKQA